MSVVEIAYFLIFLLFYTLVTILVIQQVIYIYTPEIKYSIKNPEGLYFISEYYFLNNNYFACKQFGTNFSFYFCNLTNENITDIYILGYKDYKLFNPYTRIYIFDANINVSDICSKTYSLTNNIKFCKYKNFYIFLINFSNISFKEEKILHKIINKIYKNIYYITIPKFMSVNKNYIRKMFIAIVDFLNVYPCIEAYSYLITNKPTLEINITPEKNYSRELCYLCLLNQTNNIYSFLNNSLYLSDIEPIIAYNFSKELPVDIYNIFYYNCSLYCGNNFKYEYHYNYIKLGRCWKKEFNFYKIYRAPKLPDVRFVAHNNSIYIYINISIIYLNIWC